MQKSIAVMLLGWKVRSLRRLSRITFFATSCLLAILVLTGLKQNNLIDSYNNIVEESEKTIFFYATIREQTTEAILSRDPVLLLASTQEFEKLNGRYTSVLDNHFIPSQYKLSFLKDFDLELVVINLRNLAEKPNDEDLIRKVLSQLRQINKQFLQFDRIVIGEMKNKVMQYQKSALILMGIIIALTCFTLLILYQKSVRPLLDLASQATKAQENGKLVTLVTEKNCSIEIYALISSFNQLLEFCEGKSQPGLSDKIKDTDFSATVNEVVNALNGIINYAQLRTDYCETEDIGDEQKEILEKIIKTGEKGAAILQKGFHGTEV
jgi:methyl-accepting chemotaxis protein